MIKTSSSGDKVLFWCKDSTLAKLIKKRHLNSTPGKISKLCYQQLVEKFQLSMYDNYGEIENFPTRGGILDVFYCKYLISFTLFCREILPQFTRFHVERN